jgi:hypothetical protein
MQEGRVNSKRWEGKGDASLLVEMDGLLMRERRWITTSKLYFSLVNLNETK